MRCTRFLIAAALVGAVFALPVWAQTAGPSAPSKLQVQGEEEITRPELQVVSGIRGWRVNGQEIPLSAVQDLGVLYQGPYLLQDLVARTLLEQAAKRDGITVTEADIDAKVKSLREEMGITEEATFARFLRGQRLTAQGYRDAAHTFVLMEKVLGKQVVVSDEEITAVYNAERETTYRRPEAVTFRLAATVEEKAAQAAVAQIKQGKGFQEVARSLVSNPDPKKRAVEVEVAGEEQVYAKGQSLQFPKELEMALFAAPVNQVTGPLQLKGQPYYLFFVITKKIDAYQFPLSEVRDAILKRIRRQKIEQAWPGWLDSQLSSAEITPLKAP